MPEDSVSTFVRLSVAALAIAIVVSCFCLGVLILFPVVHHAVMFLSRRSVWVREMLHYYHMKNHVTFERAENLEFRPMNSSKSQAREVQESSTDDSVSEDDRGQRTMQIDDAIDRCFGRCSCRVFLGGCALIWMLVVLLALAGLCYTGWGLVSSASNPDAWHNASITPPEFPRYMGCGSCEAGKKTDAEIQKCAQPCFNVSFVEAWEHFAQTHPWKLVYFPSRAGPNGEPPVNISAWWLPADTAGLPLGTIAPRIVVQHGFASNNNHCGVQAACFLLRTMGFSCLTPTVRDYGLSGHSEHPDTCTWGYDYQFDVLGAWDYAVADPDGFLGGPVAADQVGVMGFSRGALDVAIAFAMEPRVAGAWIDSAPWTGLFGMVDAYVRPYVGPLTPLLRNPVYWFASYMSGGTVDKYRALDMLLRANCTGLPRKLHISQDLRDSMVPITEGGDAILELSGLRDCYAVSEYIPPANCDGDTHHTYMWQWPDQARQVYCEFWSSVFKRDRSMCNLDTLPVFHYRESPSKDGPIAPHYTAFRTWPIES